MTNSQTIAHKSWAKSNEQRVTNNEQSNEQRAKNNKQQAKPNKQQAKSNEQLAKSNEQRAKGNEQRGTSEKFHLMRCWHSSSNKKDLPTFFFGPELISILLKKLLLRKRNRML